MQCVSQKQLIDSLRKTLQMIKSAEDRIEQQKMDELTISEIALKELSERYFKQTSQQKQHIHRLQKRLYQLQAVNQKLEKEENKKQKQQLRRYHQIIGEKDSQLQNFRNQTISYKHKIDNLECEVLSLKSQKQKIQIFLTKGFQQLRMELKQSSYSVQQVLLQKIVLQSKYQQLLQKLNDTLKNFMELEENHKRLQLKYGEIKIQRKGLQQKCINFQFEIAQINNKLTLSSFTQNLSPNCNMMPHLQHKESFVLAEIRSLDKYITNIERMETHLFQIGQLQKHAQQLSNKNNQLQSNNIKMQDQINDLKCLNKIINSDQILKECSLPLYDFFNQKKQQIVLFEQRLQCLQNKLVEKDKIISDLLEEQNNLKNKQEWQKNLQNQLKKLRQVLQEEQQNKLEAFRINYQKYHSQAVKAVQQNFSQTKIQNQKLKIYIDTLQKSKKKKEAMLQQIKKSATQTNRIQKLQKDNISLRNLLKAEQAINIQLKKFNLLYKKQLSSIFIPQTGKRKNNTKKTIVVRCHECYLPFQKSNLQQNCQKCKKSFHNVICYGQHNCENTNFTTSKKNSMTQKSQIDYF